MPAQPQVMNSQPQGKRSVVCGKSPIIQWQHNLRTGANKYLLLCSRVGGPPHVCVPFKPHEFACDVPVKVDVPDLIAGEYDFRVQGVNENGGGCFSEPARAVVLGQVDLHRHISRVARLCETAVEGARDLELAVKEAMKAGIDECEETILEA